MDDGKQLETDMEARAEALRDRLCARAPLVGIFVKTPHHQVIELLGGCGLDFIVLDAEHAPFGRGELDRCLLAAHAVGLPALVRIPTLAADVILSALDLGAAGIVAPHVNHAADARALARAARYRGGGRGFSASPRAGRYGARPALEHIARADAEVIVIAQIEEAEAVANLGDILATPGIDGFFIGRADLMVSLAADSLDAAPVAAATRTICAAARAAGKPLGMFLPGLAERESFAAEGVSFFIVGSDQALLKAGASSLAHSFKTHSGKTHLGSF